MSIPELIRDFSAEFDAVCEARHLEGQQKYGVFTFLEKDMIEETIKEITDASNYLRYMFIKLRLLQLALTEDERIKGLTDENGNISIGVESFHSNG